MKFIDGFDGNGISVGDRVELHPGTDLWMRGARFATVTAIRGGLASVKLDSTRILRRFRLPGDRLRRVF